MANIQSISRATNVVTCVTEFSQGFAVGAQVYITEAGSFNGTFTTTASTPVGQDAFGTVKWAQTGANETGLQSFTITSAGGPYNNNSSWGTVTLSAAHGFNDGIPRSVGPITIKGITSSSPTLASYFNKTFAVGTIKVVDSTTLAIPMVAAVVQSPWAGLVTTNATASTTNIDATVRAVTGAVETPGAIVDTVLPNVKETDAINSLLDKISSQKVTDYAFKRLFNPSDKTKINATAISAPVDINQGVSSLKSSLDTILEVFTGADGGKSRRYYVNLAGQLVYEVVPTVKPAFATAPYKITTSSAGTPNTTTDASSVAPFNLSLTWDHDTTKRAAFNVTSKTGVSSTSVVVYTNPTAALGTSIARKNAPIFDGVVDYPGKAGNATNAVNAMAKSYFVERAFPVLSGSFELRGGGTASHNSLGFSSGYRQFGLSGSATFPVKKAALTGSTLVTLTLDAAPIAPVGAGVVVSGITGAASAAMNGTFTISAVSTATTFTVAYPTTGAVGAFSYSGILAYAVNSFVRTGTAPNQIVTCTTIEPHGFSSGQSVIIAGLTGTVGSTANGTATITVTGTNTFTYPSAGTNGTAYGVGATISGFALVSRWEPGQWVEVSAIELGIPAGTLYRVETVDWALSPSSYQQIIRIGFNRRPQNQLTAQIGKGK